MMTIFRHIGISTIFTNVHCIIILRLVQLSTGLLSQFISRGLGRRLKYAQLDVQSYYVPICIKKIFVKNIKREEFLLDVNFKYHFKSVNY